MTGPVEDFSGRYIVARHWRTTWKVQDQSSNPPTDLPGHYDTPEQAAAAAQQLNHPTPRQRAHQDSLFDQEAHH